MGGDDARGAALEEGPGPPAIARATARAQGSPFFFPAYVGPQGWVGVELTGDVDWDEIRELVVESYRLVAPKKLAVQV